MSYRQSTYQPPTDARLGRAARPFNRWQWLGVALGLVGAALMVVQLAGDFGVVALKSFRVSPVAPMLLAVVLITSRREPVPDLAPDLAPARRRWLLAITAICAAVLGVAALIQFHGA